MCVFKDEAPRGICTVGIRGSRPTAERPWGMGLMEKDPPVDMCVSVEEATGEIQGQLLDGPHI